MSIFPESYSKSIGNNLNDYYKGKVCTVLISNLVSFQSKMTEEQATQTFTGVVNTINNQGICITDLVDHTRNFFFLKHVVGLREERVLDPNNPKHQKEIEVAEKALNLKKEKTKESTAYIDMNSLQEVAKKSKVIKPNDNNSFVDISYLTQIADKARN